MDAKIKYFGIGFIFLWVLRSVLHLLSTLSKIITYYVFGDLYKFDVLFILGTILILWMEYYLIIKRRIFNVNLNRFILLAVLIYLLGGISVYFEGKLETSLDFKPDVYEIYNLLNYYNYPAKAFLLNVGLFLFYFFIRNIKKS